MMRMAIVIAAVSCLDAQMKQAPRPTPTALAVSRAVTLFATDDAGPETANLLQSVINTKSASTTDVATARYYLGRLHHRNYYMLRQRDGLDRAADAYRDLHNGLFGRDRASVWHAEARFYKALAYLELGKWEDAYESIERLDPKLDADLRVDYLIWSVDKRRLDKQFATEEVRDKTLAILNGRGITKSRPDGRHAPTAAAVFQELRQLMENMSPKSR